MERAIKIIAFVGMYTSLDVREIRYFQYFS